MLCHNKPYPCFDCVDSLRRAFAVCFVPIVVIFLIVFIYTKVFYVCWLRYRHQRQFMRRESQLNATWASTHISTGLSSKTLLFNSFLHTDEYCCQKAYGNNNLKSSQPVARFKWQISIQKYLEVLESFCFMGILDVKRNN